MAGGGPLSFWLRVKYSFYSTLVFLVLTNPLTYAFTQGMVQGFMKVIDSGVPTAAGYFLHGFLFFLIILGLMMFPRD